MVSTLIRGTPVFAVEPPASVSRCSSASRLWTRFAGASDAGYAGTLGGLDPLCAPASELVMARRRNLTASLA